MTIKQTVPVHEAHSGICSFSRSLKDLQACVPYCRAYYRDFLRIGPSVNRPMGLFMENFPLVGPWAYYQQDKMTFYKKFWNRHNLIKSRHGDIINWKRTKLQTTLNVRFLSLSKLLFQIPKLYVLRPNLNLDLSLYSMSIACQYCNINLLWHCIRSSS